MGSARSSTKRTKAATAAVISSRVRARAPVPSMASVTSDVGVIGVTRLMRTATSNASFCSSRGSTSSSPDPPAGPGAVPPRPSPTASGGPSDSRSDSGSPKFTYTEP